MKLTKLAIVALAVVAFGSCKNEGSVKKVSSSELSTLEKKASYALGADMAKGIKGQISQYSSQFTDLDSNIIKAAFFEVFNGGTSQLDSATTMATLQEFGEKAMSKKKEQDSVDAIANVEAGKKFIADQMAANPKLVKTASGLVYEVLKEGSGKKPDAKSTVSAIYKGTLTDGTVFDESKGNPVDFPITGVIKGWTEGLQLMSEGAKYRFIIPAELAYGNQAPSPVIKPGSTLVFEVELVKVK